VTTPVLTTKLYIPPVRAGQVPRPRLVEQLQRCRRLGSRLTLISAPAGFGKTTLVGEWVHDLRLEATADGELKTGIAWLSLDAGDSDPVRFLTYLVAALKRPAIAPATLGEAALSNLQASHTQLPVESILTGLINELAVLSGGLVLVLDDYHLLGASPIDDALAFLRERLPP
jgi:LuxR family maltose regulon positive regulatory protein